MIEEENPQQVKSPGWQPSETILEIYRQVLKLPAHLKSILQRPNKLSGPAYESYADSIRLFAQFLMTQVKDQSSDDKLKSYLSAITTWQSTVHVIRSVAAILQAENKPLFGALNTRQVSEHY